MTRKIIYTLLLFLFSLAITSCSNRIILGVPKDNVPARDFMIEGLLASLEKYPVKGYVLFSSKPNNISSSRHLALCESYVRQFDIISEFKDKVTDENIMPTYWLLSTKAKKIVEKSNISELNNLDCKNYVELYGYARAKVLLNRVDLLSSNGPILVAWSNRSTNKEVLVFDLSSFDKNDFDRAMLIWKDRIVKNPSIWNDGFNYTKVKEVFRSFLQKYGEEIVKVIST